MNILILEKPVQDLKSSNCGIFQLYFYKNLFDPNVKSKIINHENINKWTIEVIFNFFQQTLMKMNMWNKNLRMKITCKICNVIILGIKKQSE